MFNKEFNQSGKLNEIVVLKIQNYWGDINREAGQKVCKFQEQSTLRRG